MPLHHSLHGCDDLLHLLQESLNFANLKLRATLPCTISRVRDLVSPSSDLLELMYSCLGRNASLVVDSSRPVAESNNPKHLAYAVWRSTTHFADRFLDDGPNSPFAPLVLVLNLGPSANGERDCTESPRNFICSKRLSNESHNFVGNVCLKCRARGDNCLAK